MSEHCANCEQLKQENADLRVMVEVFEDDRYWKNKYAEYDERQKKLFERFKELHAAGLYIKPVKKVFYPSNLPEQEENPEKTQK